MPQLNDEILAKTGGPTLNIGLGKWYHQHPGETLSDAELRWLKSQTGVTSNHVNDAWFEFLLAQGFTGTLNDMQLEYWKAGVSFPDLADNDLLQAYVEDGVPGTIIAEYAGPVRISDPFNIASITVVVNGTKATVTGFGIDPTTDPFGVLIEFEPPAAGGDTISFQYDARVDPGFTEDDAPNHSMDFHNQHVGNQIVVIHLPDFDFEAQVDSLGGSASVSIDGSGTIDWGDGAVVHFTSPVSTSKFVSGTMPKNGLVIIKSENATIFSFKSRNIISINLIKGIHLVSLARFMETNSRLVHVILPDLPLVTNWSKAFHDCGTLVCINKIDTTGATNVSRMFENTGRLVAPGVADKLKLETVPPGFAYVNPGACPPDAPDTPDVLDLEQLAEYLDGEGWTASAVVIEPSGPYGIEITLDGDTTLYEESQLLSCDLSDIEPLPLHNDFCDGLKEQDHCVGSDCP